MNDLIKIATRFRSLMRALRDDTRLSFNDIEIASVSDVSDEIVNQLNLSDPKEIKNALMNMYFLGINANCFK